MLPVSHFPRHLSYIDDGVIYWDTGRQEAIDETALSRE
jgi:hypothetical protein